MTKHQTMKKVAMAVIAANVVASTVITAMPGVSMAAENGTEAGNKAEMKLMGGLKANQNLLVNPEFNGFTGWSISKEGYDHNSTAIANGDGSMDTSVPYDTEALYASQIIPTVVGHKYRVKGTITNLNGNGKYQFYAAKPSNGAVIGGSGGWQNWFSVTGTKNGDFEFTAVESTTTIQMLGGTWNKSVGKIRFSDISVSDISTIETTTLEGVNTSSTNVNGVGEIGGTVTIKNTTTNTTLGTTTVGTNGAYSLNIPKQAYGSNISATVSALGLTSTATQTVTQAAIVTPTINPMTSKSGTASGTGEPGATLTFKANGVNYPTTVGTNGTWSITIPKQAGNSVVEATSVLNGVSSAKATATVAYEGPNTPVLNNVTNTSTKVTGTGDPGNTITIKVKDNGNAISYTGTIDDFGEFSVNIDTPNAGATVEAIAKDKDGALSDIASKTVLDVIAPDAPSVNAVKDTDTTISGKGEANCDVTVKLPSGGTVEGHTNVDGNFTVAIPKQAIGANIEVSLTDAAGNKGAATKVTVQADTLANPTVDRVSNQDTKVTGTGVAGATVVVKANGISYTDTVKADGTYEVAIAKQTAGTSVSVEQNKAGKTSGSVTTIVQDDAVPTAPTVNTIKDTDTAITGTGTAGNLITAKIGSETYSATVATDGSYSITIPAQTGGTNVDVSAKNTANDKVSTAVQVTVIDTTLGAPTIDGVNTSSTTVTVNGEKGATISLRLTDGTILTKVADNTGKAVISIPKQVAGAILTATQTGANGKASTAGSVTVTSNALAAPSIQDYYAGAGYVTGKAPAGASKIALYVNNQLVRYGAIDGSGNYQIYAADNAKMNTAGTAFQVVALDADGNMGVKANATVLAKTAAPSIQEYYTTDVYAKGTATGASKVTLYVNGKAVRTAAVSNGSYSIYTGDQASLAIAGNTFQVSASNAAGIESAKTTATVKSKLTAPVINKYVATDAYARGTASAGSKQVVLYVNGKAVRTANVNADGTYSIYTGDQASLTTAGNTFQISSKDAAGNESPKATGTVVSALAAPTIATYYATNVYATGTTPAGASKVALYVNGKFVRYAAVTNNAYSIYTGDQASLGVVGNTFQIAAVDAKGTIGTMATGTVQADNRAASKLTTNGYNMATDQTANGTAGTSIARVKISVNGEVKRQTTVSGGAYAIYAKDIITATSDVVEIIGYDANGYEINRVTVPVTNAAPQTYALTANPYNTTTNENVTGTADAGITRVQLVVNDVVVRATATASGAYAIYAKDAIKSGDKVEIVGLDSGNVERNRVNVTVSDALPATYNVTANQYNIFSGENVTGTADAAVTRVKLVVNGTDVRTTATSGGSYAIYAQDQIKTTSDVVQIVALDKDGVARKTINVDVVNNNPAAKTITPADYTIGTDNITGTFGSDVKKVQLFVNGAFARQAAITGNAFTVYAADKVTSATQTVEMVGFDSSGAEIVRQAVTVK
ncbi:Ig-like domain-containing protein [Listeria booriae]|uniref:Bacterial Ig domain-containing protein n=1 Tax=Listeria booriae TaxID=1552123 RepID=A0A099W0M7_9LIST|nr:Ig-like domain-containing protein [Listeria booriae]KGL37938.1 hypothetical protein EP57_15380 [Listeria booriae]STY45935.1 Uncharacterised protein [Listeria booriae]